MQVRQRAPPRPQTRRGAQAPPGCPLATSTAGVSSRFFEVRGRLRLDDRVLEERSLVERRKLDIVVLRRERVNQNDGAGS